MTIILLLVHYKGEKTQRMKDHRDNVTPYLDEFVNDDLAFLGMPAPNQCACTWQSGYIKCMWSTDRGSYMQRYISAAFRAIDVQCLPSRSISKIGLSIDGPSAKARYITAASVKHPSAAYTSYQKHSTSHTARSWELGKAPSAPKTFTIARVAASPMPCPSGSATSRIGDRFSAS
ncbi:uncharacterized protein C8Q71DRAFT_779038 [Rhodofomes roseus]|uniref:Uncharacterized protein n=1 Tax=Rhodofomes roseus TaxID=34475 RepID=A0ABQ8K5M5_9APHY|nr:uncharacterized protein C8Q71DRAFT_779038 [Rhodofomes roseus]KAH9831994.1 hypothetical protein C8Q71DRAFT_779038 [Rhodofomes roseus]